MYRVFVHTPLEDDVRCSLVSLVLADQDLIPLRDKGITLSH